MIPEHHPLSPEEVQKIAGCPMRFTKYSDIDDFPTIEDMFDGTECVLILYETIKNSGHWCCILNSEDKIDFFDSYGLVPDNELLFVNIKFREENDMLIPHLSKLFLKTEKCIEYNDKRLQKMAEGINTCGYWCGMRMRYRHFSCEEFIKMFKGGPRDEKDTKVIEMANKYLE